MLCFTILSSTPLFAEKKLVSLKDVPAKALKALVVQANGARLLEVEKETEDGVITYEADWGQEDKTYEARVDSDGKLLELEHRATRDDLLDEVRKTVKRFLPKGGDPIFELKMSATYEAEVEIDGKEFGLLIAPDGEILEAEGIDVAKLKANKFEDQGEEKVDPNRLSRAVKKAISAKFPDFKIEEIEIENGIYDIEGTSDGKGIEMEIRPDGKILEVEIDDDE